MSMNPHAQIKKLLDEIFHLRESGDFSQFRKILQLAEDDILYLEETFHQHNIVLRYGFPGGSDGKESACNAGDLPLVPGLRRSPEGWHGNPLQYSCLQNPQDRGTWQATVHEVVNSWTQLSD